MGAPDPPHRQGGLFLIERLSFSSSSARNKRKRITACVVSGSNQLWCFWPRQLRDGFGAGTGLFQPHGDVTLASHNPKPAVVPSLRSGWPAVRPFDRDSGALWSDTPSTYRTLQKNKDSFSYSWAFGFGEALKQYKTLRFHPGGAYQKTFRVQPAVPVTPEAQACPNVIFFFIFLNVFLFIDLPLREQW